jgi:hypothetical protein
LVEERAGLGLVVVARNNRRRIAGKLGDALEHILGRVRREVRNQLIVDRQIRRQDKEVVQPVRQVQIADKRPHQAGLAHARGQGKAHGRKFPLEIRDARELGTDGCQSCPHVPILSGRRDFRNTVQDFQRLPLGRP